MLRPASMTALPTVDPSLSCAEQSLAAGEALAGSAAGPIRHWLLIEHRGRWERDVTATLPEPLALSLAALSATFPGTRPQLIRRKEQRGPLSLYLVRASLDGAPGVVEHRTAGSLDEVDAIDWHAVLSGEPLGPRHERPLYLVCTHGRRDRCCAKLGVPLLRALMKTAPDAEVWQTSHIGGHRFAPTLAYLPHGMCYGRLQLDDIPEMVRAHTQGRLLSLKRCRGQTRFAPATQAAALWWRRQHHQDALDALASAEQQTVAGGFAVQLHPREGAPVSVHVTRTTSDATRLSSCAADTPSPVAHFQVSIAAPKAEPS